MAAQNLQEILEKEWQSVRKRFYYPQLPAPRLVEDEKLTGQINLNNLEITISEDFIKYLESAGINSENSLNATLTHEVTHFMRYPGSVLDALRLQKAGQEIIDSDKVAELRTNFVEAQTNLYVVNELKHPEISKVLKAISTKFPGSSLTKLMNGLYQELSGQDFGANLSSQEKGLINKLKNISFTNKSREISNFKKYVEVLKDYQDSQDNSEGNSKGSSQGDSSKNKNPFSNGGNKFTKNEIREGLKQFAEECENSKEYEQVVKEVFPELAKPLTDSETEQSPKSTNPSVGSDKGITILANNFYSALAEKYAIPIREKPMNKDGSLYPYSHSPFELGDSLTEVDNFSTPGILPGITKKWIRKEGECFNHGESIPDSFLAIDNSPSMTFEGSPNEIIYPHLIGATAIANAYLFNGGKVAVYSFGSEDYITSLTNDKELIHKQIMKYSSSGGTVFNPSLFEKILKSSENPFDVTIISDLGIHNLDGFINSILKIPNTHRVHILYTNSSGSNFSSKNKIQHKGNLSILPLTCEKDISKIVMGELKKSIY